MDKVKTGIKVTTFFLSFYLFLNLAYSHAVKSDEEKQNKGLISRTRGAVKNFINNTEFVEQQGNLDAFSVAISGPGGLVRETDKDIELKTHQRFLRKMVDAHPKAERYVKQQFNISYKEVINEENENLENEFNEEDQFNENLESEFNENQKEFEAKKKELEKLEEETETETSSSRTLEDIGLSIRSTSSICTIR